MRCLDRTEDGLPQADLRPEGRPLPAPLRAVSAESGPQLLKLEAKLVSGVPDTYRHGAGSSGSLPQRY